MLELLARRAGRRRTRQVQTPPWLCPLRTNSVASGSGLDSSPGHDLRHGRPPPWRGGGNGAGTSSNARGAEALVADASIRRRALVLDIGAGVGAITEPLLRVGARVVAVEAHHGRAMTLRERFGGEVVVVEADAADLRLPKTAYYVVANPPFGVSTALLRRLLQPGSRLVAARLILQDPVARRWAGPDAPGARRWSRSFTASLGQRVPRRAFTPRPRVDARVLMIDRSG